MRYENATVVASDVHLAPYAWKSHPEIKGDAYFALKQLVDHCVAASAPELLLAGDIIDRVDVDPLTMRVLHEQCSRLQAANVQVRFIVGQHERHTLAQWLNVHDWPIYSHEQSWSSELGRWYALDWQTRDNTLRSFQNIPRDCELLLTHHVWKEFGGEMMNPECALADVHHATHVFTGDYHVAGVRNGTNAQGAPVVAYSPGSTCMQALDEPAQKSFYAVTRSDGVLRVNKVPLLSRPLLKYDLKEPRDLDWLIDSDFPEWCKTAEQTPLPEEIRKPILEVKYPATWPQAYQRIRAGIGDRGHFFAKPQRAADDVVSVTPQQLKQLSGSLVNGIDLVAQPSDAHYDDLKTLLSLPNDPALMRETIAAISKRIEEKLTAAPPPKTVSPAARTRTRSR